MRADALYAPIRKHPGLAAAFLAAVIVFLTLRRLRDAVIMSATMQVVLSWDVFVVVYLVAAIVIIGKSEHADIKQRAARYDESDSVIMLLCLLAAVMSLVAVVKLLAGINADVRAAHLTLAVITVTLSWFFLHTVMAVHYAHAYYWPKQLAAGTPAGGLAFPGDELPNYLDFVYFAFVIGATAQTSDVAITAKPIRRLATLHGTVSFAFNTVLLALTVSVAATLLFSSPAATP